MVVAKQQASNFPSVGMTLRSYKYDPSDKNNRAGKATVVKTSRWQRFRKGVTLKRTAIVMAVLVLLVGGWLGFKFVHNAQKLFGGNILNVLSTTKLKGEDRGRVNILLAGNSADDAGHNGAELTDSIMILSIDTKNNKAFMLSIPRDLWVDIPGNGHAKINSAYVDGEADNFKEDGFPEGGMGLLEKVIETNFDVPIDYYALVNYNAFREAVNAVGGIDVTIASEDPRGLYDPNIDYSDGSPLVKLANGKQHLNGQDALNLARARGDSSRSYGFPQSDFNRTENQRMMLVALKDKVTTAGVIANPAKLSSLSDAIGNNVKTDFQLSEVRRLYDISKKINNNTIQSLSLNDADGENLLASYTGPGGQSALIPAAGLDDFTEIQAFLKRQMSSNPVVQENASVVVLNGTDSPGLATKKRTVLTEKEINVDAVGDGQGVQATTQIIDVSGGKKPATLAVLKQLFGKNVTTTNPYAGTYETDFIIVLGNDQVPAPASGTSAAGQ
jgi:LCP family protein required for cell wall assembly